MFEWQLKEFFNTLYTVTGNIFEWQKSQKMPILKSSQWILLEFLFYIHLDIPVKIGKFIIIIVKSLLIIVSKSIKWPRSKVNVMCGSVNFRWASQCGWASYFMLFFSFVTWYNCGGMDIFGLLKCDNIDRTWQLLNLSFVFLSMYLFFNESGWYGSESDIVWIRADNCDSINRDRKYFFSGCKQCTSGLNLAITCSGWIFDPFLWDICVVQSYSLLD